jgi:hypothetical protein
MKRREFIAFLARFYPFPYVVTEGGLISHGVDVADIYRRAAGYADRILIEREQTTGPSGARTCQILSGSRTSRPQRSCTSPFRSNT